MPYAKERVKSQESRSRLEIVGETATSHLKDMAQEEVIATEYVNFLETPAFKTLDDAITAGDSGFALQKPRLRFSRHVPGLDRRCQIDITNPQAIGSL